MKKQTFEKTENIWKILGIYTLIFIILSLMVRAIFQDNNISFIWSPDGEFIYFPSMVYTRGYILNIVRTFLRSGELILPAWDFSIGQGNNVLSVLQFNPFLVLSFFVTSKNLASVYGFIEFVQWYSVGVAFIVFCRRIGRSETLPVVLGTLVYTFSGYAVFAGTKHINFIVYMLFYFVVMLIGVERYLQEKKWGFFVGSIILAMIGGYYGAFMNSLLMAVYVIFRQLAVNGRDIKKSVTEIIRLIGYYLWALALSMIIFLPKLINYFNCSRSGQYTENFKWLYQLNNYKTLFTSFVTPDMDVGWSQLSFAGIAFVAAVVLFVRKGKYSTILRGAFLTLTAFLCLPIAGKIFNGFGYVSSRWCFAYAFFMGLLVVFSVPEMFKLTVKQKIILGIVTVVYAVGVLLLNQDIRIIIGMAFLAGVSIIVFCMNRLPWKWVGAVLLLGITIGQAGMLLHINYSPEYDNGVAAYVKEKKLNQNMSGSVEALASRLDDDTFHRVEVRATRSNRFVITGGYGTNSYWSTLPAKLVNYYLDFEMDSVRQNYAVWGLDERASVCTLSGVKYDLCAAGYKGESVPYGFKEIDVMKGTDKEYVVYENEYALPLGYTYTTCISREEYEQLSPIQRQQAMLQSAVVEDSELDITYEQPQLSVQNIECTIAETKDVVVADDDVYDVKSGGSITFEFDGAKDSETYLYLKDLEYNGAILSGKITVTSGNVRRAATVYEETSIYYFEREGISFNLGYSENGKSTCTVVFENEGRYTFHPVVMCSPMEDYVRDVTERKEVVLEDIEEYANRITGKLHLTDKRILALTIPNYGGWEAYVNGEKAELLDVNTMYMGLLLDEGDYEIELRYTTPGLKISSVISGIGVMGLILYGVISKIKRRRSCESQKQMKEA